MDCKIRVTAVAKRILCIITLLCLSCILNAQINYPHLINGTHLALSKENYKEAISELNQAIALRPDNFEPYYLRGYAKYCLEDFSGAINDFEKARTINPLYIKAFLHHGFCNMQMKNYGEAIRDFEDGLKIDPFDTDLFIARAAVYLQIGQYEKAIADYDFALGFKPELSPATRSNMALAYVNRGIAKAHLKQYDDALADLDKAFHYDFLNAEIPFRRGLVQLQRGADAIATADFAKALKLDPKNPLYLYYHASALLETGDTINALNEYEQVNRLDPRNALTYFRRGVIYSVRNEFEKALEMYGLVTTINPDNIYGYFNRSLIYCEQKQWNKAETDLSKVLQLNPIFVGAWINRSFVRQEKGDFQGSRSDHQQALRVIEARHGSNRDLEILYKQYTDSVYFDKITAFNADFVNGETRNKRPQYSEGDILPFPDFVLTFIGEEEYPEIDKLPHTYLEQQLSLLNSSGILPVKLVLRIEDPYRSSRLYIDEAVFNTINDLELRNLFRGVIEQRNENFNHAEACYRRLSHDSELESYAILNRSVILSKIEHQMTTAKNSKLPPPSLIAGIKDTTAIDCTRIIDLLSNKLSNGTKSAFLWYNLANAYLQTKAYDRAIDAYGEALSLRPGLAEAYFNRALTLIYIGENALARSDLSKAGELGISEAYAVLKRFGKW